MEDSANSSNSSSDPWLCLQQDFQEALESLKQNINQPAKAWQQLSRVLIRHSSVACHPEPWKLAVPSKLLWTMSRCIALIIGHYKYHQESRIKDLCQLCELTGQLYVQCAQHQDVGVRVSLAKQASDSDVLQAVCSGIMEVCDALTQAESLVNAAASQPQATSSKGNKQVRGAFDDLVGVLQLAQVYMRLFKALHSIWPGQTGVFSSKAGDETAAAAEYAAAQILLLMTAAVDYNVVPADAAERYVRCAVEMMVLRAQHVNINLVRALQDGGGSILMLCYALLLWGLHLESSTAACTACKECSAASRDSNPSSTAANSGPNSSSTTAATAGPTTACVRCSSRYELLLLLRPQVGNISMSNHLWQVAVNTAAEGLSSLQRHLELLQVLLQQLQERMTVDSKEGYDPTGTEDEVPCRVLAPLIVTLLDTASNWWHSGQQQQAEAAIAATEAAAEAWQLSCSLRGTRYFNRHGDPKRQETPCGQYEIDSVAEIVALVTQLLQQVLSSDNSSSSSGGNCSGRDSSCMQEALLFILAQTLEAAEELFFTVSGGKPAMVQELPAVQPSVAAVEATIRAVAPAAAADHVNIQRLLDDLDPIQKNLQKELESRYRLADSTEWWIAASGRPDCPAAPYSKAESQLFALQVSSLKLLTIQPELCLPHSIAELALAHVKALSKSGQPATVQPAAATMMLLHAAMPWLMLMARCLIAMGAWLAAESGMLKQQAAAAAGATPPAASNNKESGVKPTSWNALMRMIRTLLHDICDRLRLVVLEQTPNTVSAATTAAAPSAVVQPELVQLLQQWEQQLLPLMEQASLLLSYVEDLTFHQRHVGVSLKELSSAAATAMAAAAAGVTGTTVIEAAQQAAAVTGPDEYQTHKGRLLIAFNTALMQQLPQQLEAAGNQLCALLPLPLCCNNPGCGNMSRQSELELVGGKACVCAGCEVARYCGRECQAAHWQQHKRVCKMIKKSRAAVSSQTS